MVPHLRYLLPQRGESRGGGVLVLTLPHRPCESLDCEFGGLEVRLAEPNCTASSSAMSNILLTPVGRMVFERSEKLTMTRGLAS